MAAAWAADSTAAALAEADSTAAAWAEADSMAVAAVAMVVAADTANRPR
jgi:hypothetical protein